MLIRFGVENFRSIRDYVELSMLPIEGVTENQEMLRVAGVFGPNASGKSNILRALYWLSNAIKNSFTWEGEIPVEPFAHSDFRDKNSEFVVEMIVSNVRYKYLLSIGQRGKEYEALFRGDEDEIVFEYDGGVLNPGSLDFFLQVFESLNFSSFLTASIAWKSNIKDDNVKEFFNRLVQIAPLGRLLDDRKAERAYKQQSMLMLDGDDHVRSRVLAILKTADLGIDDVTIKKDQNNVLTDLDFIHRSNADGNMTLAYDEESNGTKVWFELIGILVEILDTGKIALFDEIDAGLHSALTAKFVEIFDDPDLNPNGAQLIFTSHDVTLLNKMDRDQIWFTEKNREGVTDLFSLAEFEDDEIPAGVESSYMSGRFGALPDVFYPVSVLLRQESRCER